MWPSQSTATPPPCPPEFVYVHSSPGQALPGHDVYTCTPQCQEHMHTLWGHACVHEAHTFASSSVHVHVLLSPQPVPGH